MAGLKGVSFHLRTVHKLLINILKAHDHNLYKLDVPLKGENLKKQAVDVSGRLFEEPYVELFIWAILTKRKTLIDFCWIRSGQPILMAIIASAIYSKLGWFYRSQKDYKALQGSKQTFQEKANKLIELAYEVDPGKAFSLLEKRNPRWGDRNLMQLGYIGHLRKFIASGLHFYYIRTRGRLYCFSVCLIFRPYLPNGSQCIVEKRIHKATPNRLLYGFIFALDRLHANGEIFGAY